MLYEDITEQIIAAAHRVHNTLGAGFLESVYGNALYYELESRDLKCECQKKINVYYNGHLVGDYRADMIVEDKIIVELKALKELHVEHQRQLLNYLVATNMPVGLLINFGTSVNVKRLIHTKHKNP